MATQLLRHKGYSVHLLSIPPVTGGEYRLESPICGQVPLETYSNVYRIDYISCATCYFAYEQLEERFMHTARLLWYSLVFDFILVSLSPMCLRWTAISAVLLQ